MPASEKRKNTENLHAGMWNMVVAALGNSMTWWNPGDLCPSFDSIICWLCDLWDSVFSPVKEDSSLYKPILWIKKTSKSVEPVLDNLSCSLRPDFIYLTFIKWTSYWAPVLCLK